MNVVSGNLITLAERGLFDVIIHGCNCYCAMGAGIALDIKNQYPDAYQADLDTEKGDSNKLGTFSYHQYPKEANENYGLYGLVVVNAYTQFLYGRGLQADYESIDAVFKIIGQTNRNTDIRIAYPRIGAGLAGGDWNHISQIIDKRLYGCNHTLVEWDGT